MKNDIFDLNFINNLNKNYSLLRSTFSKSYLKVLESKQDLKSKMIGFMTPAYYKRKDLILHGAIMYAFTFKINNFDCINSRYIDSWVLFSSDYDFRESPAKYNYFVSKLNDFLQGKSNYKNKKLLSALLSNENSYRYFLLPKELSDDKIIYYSNILIDTQLNKDIELGLNVVIANKAISNEILYLSDDVFKKLTDMENSKNVK